MPLKEDLENFSLLMKQRLEMVSKKKASDALSTTTGAHTGEGSYTLNNHSCVTPLSSKMLLYRPEDTNILNKYVPI